MGDAFPASFCRLRCSRDHLRLRGRASLHLGWRSSRRSVVLACEPPAITLFREEENWTLLESDRPAYCRPRNTMYVGAGSNSSEGT